VRGCAAIHCSLPLQQVAFDGHIVLDEGSVLCVCAAARICRDRVTGSTIRICWVLGVIVCSTLATLLVCVCVCVREGEKESVCVCLAGACSKG
jgi:hypothetical protein